MKSTIKYLGKTITFDGWYYHVEGYEPAFTFLSRAKQYVKELERK